MQTHWEQALIPNSWWVRVSVFLSECLSESTVLQRWKWLILLFITSYERTDLLFFVCFWIIFHYLFHDIPFLGLKLSILPLVTGSLSFSNCKHTQGSQEMMHASIEHTPGASKILYYHLSFQSLLKQPDAMTPLSSYDISDNFKITCEGP